jgi:hypothetical protein
MGLHRHHEFLAIFHTHAHVTLANVRGKSEVPRTQHQYPLRDTEASQWMSLSVANHNHHGLVHNGHSLAYLH